MMLVSLIGEVLSWSSSRSKTLWATTPPPPPTRSLPSWYMAVAPTRFRPVCHPRAEEVIREVDAYFLENWPFPNDKARTKFKGADFTRNMCYNYPEALDGRIGVACRLITLLFLIDDLLDYMSLEDGRLYNAKIMALMRGEITPDRTLAVEWMSYDIWAEMRALDARLSSEVLGPLEEFMVAQTEDKRFQKMTMGEYLEWRGRDVGASLVTALGRFSMGLLMSVEDLSLVEPLDRNWFRHVSVINDVWSYDKEVRQSKSSGEEGAVLCSSVAILCEEMQVSAEASKRTLTCLCREWEGLHQTLEQEILAEKDTPAIRQYIRGLEHQMSGNEIWSTFTLRYAPPSHQEICK